MQQKNQGRSLLQTALAAGMLLAATSLHAQRAPMDTDLYCAGFFTTRAVESGLAVKSGEDGGFKYEFVAGDYIYLSRGQNTIVNTGGQYMILRPNVDVNRKESFPGQQLMVHGMGKLYSEVGRIEVKVVARAHATAQVLRSCEPIEPGDIAIPLNARTAPAYKTQRITPRFAEPSGKAAGVIATAKEFDREVGEGRIVYLNIGSGQGLQPGSYLRIRRPFSTDADAFNVDAREYRNHDGTPQRPMLKSELAAMPSEVLGEVMVLSTEETSATGIITYSRVEVIVGDSVELE
ncbi:MAG: hypothetical protein EXQ56_13390 [Acidobacteria bacterium]|nr:hypothetical protein [Acidobacteriota bacterium]